MKRPRLNPDWPAEVVEIYRNDMREIWDRNLERHSFNCYQNQLRFYLELTARFAPATVLDVGCAQGTLALLLAEQGSEVTAVDIRPEFLRYAEARHEKGAIRFVAANIFDEPDLGQFDLVFANQIIEHVVYPADLIRTLSRYLTSSGVLVVTTPNHDYFRSSLPSFGELGDPRLHEHKQFTAGGGDHFFAYTEEELRAEAEAAGMQVTETHYFETPIISGHMLVRFIHRATPMTVLSALDRLLLRLAPRRTAHQLCMVMRRR